VKDIMKLVDGYIIELLVAVGREYGLHRVTATTNGKTRVALQSAIEALQKDAERYRWMRDTPETTPMEIMELYDGRDWDSLIDMEIKDAGAIYRFDSVEQTIASLKDKG
jgi:uncharacterized protein YmfQ (DUF2313 family)